MTVATLLVGVTRYLALLSRDALVTVVAAVVLVGLGMGWSPPVQSRAVDQLTDTEHGTGFGLIRTVYIAFADLCGVVIGGAVTISGWASAIVTLAVVLAVPAVALGANVVFRIGL